MKLQDWHRLIILLVLCFGGMSTFGRGITPADHSHRVSANLLESELATLYREKRYFDLRDLLTKDQSVGKPHRLFFEAVIANKFFKPGVSVRYLERYLAEHSLGGDSPWLLESYELLADNYRKTFQYRKAAETYNLILRKFGTTLKDSDKGDYENSYNLWNSLSRVPAQTVTFRGSTTLKGSLRAVPVQINRHRLSLGIDSGADISIIINSLAQELGMQIIDASIQVGSITGGTVNVRLGVAREIKLGRVVIHNAVFLVFDDKDLLGPSEGTLSDHLGFERDHDCRE